MIGRNVTATRHVASVGARDMLMLDRDTPTRIRALSIIERDILIHAGNRAIAGGECTTAADDEMIAACDHIIAGRARKRIV